MRRIEILFALGVLLLTRVGVVAQHQHASSHSQAKVMGFDQSRTTHHFSLYKDGGAIEVTVNDSGDTANRDAIRAHLQHIVVMFANGDFNAPMLVHDSNDVPGTKEMSRLKDHVGYTYVEVPSGGRINIMTSDQKATDAVHQFLQFQIREHKTGDPTAVQSR